MGGELIVRAADVMILFVRATNREAHTHTASESCDLLRNLMNLIQS